MGVGFENSPEEASPEMGADVKSAVEAGVDDISPSPGPKRLE